MRILNGGRQKWMAEGRPLTTEPTLVTPTHYHAQAPDPSFRALREYVHESIGRADRVLVDVRTPQEYSGEWFMIQPPKGTERTGHIPGAVHIGYELAHNDDGTVPDPVSSKSAEPYTKYARAAWTAISHDSLEITFAFGSTPPTHRIHAVLCFHNSGSSRSTHSVS